MKKRSVKGILFSIFIGIWILLLESGWFPIPVSCGKELLYFFISNRSRITDFSYFAEKESRFYVSVTVQHLCSLCCLVPVSFSYKFRGKIVGNPIFWYITGMDFLHMEGFKICLTKF